MSRSLGMPLLLVSLVVAAFLFATQMRSNGPTAPAVTRMETQAIQAAAGTNFAAAGQVLQAYFAQSGTYAGAALDPSYQVTLARADSTSYCLQAGIGTGMQHETGPAGTVQPGPC